MIYSNTEKYLPKKANCGSGTEMSVDRKLKLSITFLLMLSYRSSMNRFEFNFVVSFLNSLNLLIHWDLLLETKVFSSSLFFGIRMKGFLLKI